MSVIQRDFSGGMNLFNDDTALADNEYALAYNVRNRNTSLSEIRRPLEDETAPSGKKQGIFTFDKYAIIFVAGKAYYKNIITDSIWTQIAGFEMDPTVDYLYTAAVPASTLNFVRKLITTDQVNGSSLTIPVSYNTLTTNGLTQAGLIVQDGINQPWIIFPDATARKLNTYAQWMQPFHGVTYPREYVPIMKQMLFTSNGILFGIAPDGRTIYRSVSGRPIDFVVNVDQNGHKGGDASTTAYAVGYNEITCLQELADGGLFIGTTNGSVILELNYDKTIFAEPTFIRRGTLPAGVINQFSLIEIIKPEGNIIHHFIDKDGLRIFASDLLNDKNEGRNSLFTNRISGALASKQTIGAAILFNDYSIFSIKTNYSNDNLLAIYDNLRQVWACFDNYSNFGSVKQFAVADQSDNPVLYAITNDKVFKLFSDPLNYAISVLFLRAETSGGAKVHIKLDNVYTVFSGGQFNSNVICEEWVNGSLDKQITHSLEESNVDVKRFNFNSFGSALGWKIQPKLTWQNGATLEVVECEYVGKTSATPPSQQAKTYAN